MKHVPVITLTTAALAVLATMLPGVEDRFELSRQGIAATQGWRMVTGHVVHFGWSHLTWDVAAFVLLGSMAESLLGASEAPVLTTRALRPGHAMNGTRKSDSGPVSNRLRLVRRASFAAFIVGVAVCLSTAVLWLQPHLARYRGLSGIDSALFGFIAQRLIGRGRSLRNPRLMGLSILLLIGFLAKCVYELATRQSAFASANAALPFEPVPLVHVLGLLLGIGYALVTAPSDQSKPTTILRSSNDYKALSPPGGACVVVPGTAHHLPTPANAPIHRPRVPLRQCPCPE
ncbi:MAG: rhomboid family intramembrane serine protease [Opitutaceae bacterium]|nr:rhomboid family intramembrane serine protease [Opitutaceae bacterium]